MSTETQGLIDEAICRHKAKDHYPISHDDIDAILEERTETHGLVDRMADMIEGTPVVDLHGNVTGREPGIKQMVEEIYERTNGGVNVTQKIVWSPKHKVAAWGVASMFVVGAMSSLVTLIAIFAGG